MDKQEFYDGNKLLSLMDEHGRRPEMYFCCGNRSAGKTFFFKRYMVRRFLKHGEKFVIFVRNKNMVTGKAAAFWADVGPICFPRHDMTQRNFPGEYAAELYIDKKPCGYVVQLNMVKPVKENSALFADAARGFLDEFQSDDGRYLSDEYGKFDTVRMSIARGGATGKHMRYFPIYLCSNNVTLFNPYFETLGISHRLTNRTHYMRGDGWVLEQVFNMQAASQIGAMRTLSDKQRAHAANNQYLLDTNAYVKHVGGDKRLEYGIIVDGRRYLLWSARSTRQWYVTRKLKGTPPAWLTADLSMHAEGVVLAERGNAVVSMLRGLYQLGNVYFQDGSCRNAMLRFLSYK